MRRRTRIFALLFVGLLLGDAAPRVAAAWTVAAWTSAATAPQDAGHSVDCTLTYDNLSELYVDVGARQGLREAGTGWVVFEGRRVARIEVEALAAGSAVLLVQGAREVRFPRADDRITLLLDEAAGSDETPTEDPEHTGDEETHLRPGETQDFRPLLAPNLRDVGVTDPRTVPHGTVGLRHQVQLTSNGLLDLSRTVLDSRGAVERMGGTPWSIEWDSDLSYRAGRGYQEVRDHESFRLEIERLAISRRFDDASILRVGRFLPRELPAVGYLDGLQFENVVSRKWRTGLLIGAKPDHDDLGFSIDEPTVVPYLSYGSAEDGHVSSVTAGVLASWFEGDLDRLALLVDQRLTVGDLDLWSSLELDSDAGGAETFDGVRITRGDVAVSLRRDGWTPRFGIDHQHSPDTEAERFLLHDFLLDAEDFEDRFTRTYVGARHDLSRRFVLDEEVSYGSSRADHQVRGRVSLTDRELLGRPGSSTTLTVYRAVGIDQDGLGAQLTMLWPFAAGRGFLQPAITHRRVRFDLDDEVLSYTDLSLRATWQLARAWQCSLLGAVSDSDGVRRGLAELGLTWRF